MPAFQSVTTASTFTVGDTIETEVFDLKMRVDTYTPVNLAMMVAQLANHLGGTVLIGAEEKAGRICAIHELTAADEAATRQNISAAVEQCCVPQPLIGPVAIPHGNGFLVAINIEASLAGVIGVKIKTDKVVVGYGGASYVFPVRVGIAGGFITPDNMHNHMLPQLRRLIITLRSMAPSDEVYFHGYNFGGSGQSGNIVSVTVDESGNRALFLYADAANRQIPIVHPLDFITTPWRTHHNDRWDVFLKDPRT